ncbi:MAG: HlyD family efflux transporter periplasmic adaptor subunit, partial [Pseudomonadota bacterium]
RQRDLLARGAGTAAAEETAALALSGAEQALLGRRQALAQAQASLDRAVIARDRSRISREEAARDLVSTEIRAPFAARVADVSVVLGGLVSASEQVATLIDPSALEVVFRVSNTEFGRLASAGSLLGRPITATLPAAAAPLSVPGVIDRAAAEVGTAGTGRRLYAALDPMATDPLRPGDFMVVEVSEPPLDTVAIIPARAANAAGEILLVGADNRLELAQVEVLRRQGDLLIVGAAPFGREYVTELLPQLGSGVRVRPVRPEPRGGAAGSAALSPERRAALIAAVEVDARLTEARRGAILARLAADDVPIALIERLEAQIAGRGAPSETLALDAARRARLVAYVQGDPVIADDQRERLLGQLNAEEVPRAVVERLEARMGG